MHAARNNFLVPGRAGMRSFRPAADFRDGPRRWNETRSKFSGTAGRRVPGITVRVVPRPIPA